MVMSFACSGSTRASDMAAVVATFAPSPMTQTKNRTHHLPNAERMRYVLRHGPGIEMMGQRKKKKSKGNKERDKILEKNCKGKIIIINEMKKENMLEKLYKFLSLPQTFLLLLLGRYYSFIRIFLCIKQPTSKYLTKLSSLKLIMEINFFGF